MNENAKGVISGIPEITFSDPKERQLSAKSTISVAGGARSTGLFWRDFLPRR